MFGWFSPVFTQLTKLSFLDFELTNSETALGCFQVMSYVNSVAIGIILDKSWVPQQCVVTSLQTHRRFSGTFVLTFPKTHASLLHLTFPFPSPKPTTHQQLNWSRAPVPPISTRPSSRSAPFTDSIFRWDPNAPLPSVYMPETTGFCLFFFFSMFLHFLHCVYWDVGSLSCECLFIYASFFTLYSSIATHVYASFFVFILEVFFSCSFVTTMVLWTMSALLCCWLGGKKIICTETLPKHRHRFLKV